jgi:6-phosphogluconolactonase
VNRADTTIDFQGQKVFAGGENTLVVYAIDQKTGEPTAIQHIDTGAIHCRTFQVDPSGRMLVAAHNVQMLVRDGAGVKSMPACLSIFRIGSDGKLAFVRKIDVDTRGQIMFWTGMV